MARLNMHVETLFFFILLSVCLFACVIYYPYPSRVIKTTKTTGGGGVIVETTTYDADPETPVLKM